MKHFFSFLLLLFSTITLASVQVQPGLTLTHGSHSYLVQYSNTEYLVRDTTLYDSSSGHLFSYVQLLPDYYDYVGEVGSPMYPAYTLFLQLPNDATNVHVELVNKQTTTVTIRNPYLPVQLTLEDDTINTLNFNQSFYNSSSLIESYYANWYTMEAPYTRLRSLGTNLTIYPVHYHTNNTATVLTNAVFRITYDGSALNNLYSSVDLVDARFFDNYLDPDYYQPQNSVPVIDGDEYLIITSKKYENEIQLFKNFKTSLGYNVTVCYIDDIGNTPVAIRNCISSHYLRPEGLRYVLLAGDIRQIPYSSGNNLEYFNEYSDILYYCLDNIDISKQSKYHPHVYLGRWDFSTRAELLTIIQKTIHSEQNMYYNDSAKRMHVFSGTGPNDYNKRALWVKDNIINKTPKIVGNYTLGSSANIVTGTPYFDIKVELVASDNPLWMLVYFGKGNRHLLDPPYNFNINSIDSCINKTHQYQPFACIFTSLAGYLHSSICFATHWLKVENGGIGILASSKNTWSECNKWFSHILLEPLVTYHSHFTIGQLVADGKEKYYYKDKVAYRKQHMASYNYLGDPSLYVYGLNLQNQQNQMPQKVDREIETDPYWIKVFTTMGLLLVESAYDSFDTNILPNGTFILQITDKENNILSTQKILK